MNIEYIKWIDSYGTYSSWKETKEIELENHFCYSTGFVIKENDTMLCIASHYNPNNDFIDAEEQVSGYMFIPKCSIIERQILS